MNSKFASIVFVTVAFSSMSNCFGNLFHGMAVDAAREYAAKNVVDNWDQELGPKIIEAVDEIDVCDSEIGDHWFAVIPAVLDAVDKKVIDFCYCNKMSSEIYERYLRQPATKLNKDIELTEEEKEYLTWMPFLPALAKSESFFEHITARIFRSSLAKALL